MKVTVEVDLCEILELRDFNTDISIEEIKNIVQEKTQLIVNNVIYSKEVWNKSNDVE